MKNNLSKYGVISLLLFLSALSVQAESRVYLLARVAFDGSTYGQAAFFYDREVGDIATCEQDIARGRLGQWQYYGHFVRKIKGAATTVSYNCITADLSISEWMSNYRYSYVYLIDRRARDIKVYPHDNYANCLTALQQTQKKESDLFYCSKFNQSIGLAAQ